MGLRLRVAVLAYIQQMRDNERTGLDHAVGPKTPGFTAMGIFLFFGSTRRVSPQLLCFGEAPFSIVPGLSIR